jgi:CcmD family protein
MTWLIAAYMAIWIAMFIYTLSLDRKSRAMARELDRLRSRLND